MTKTAVVRYNNGLVFIPAKSYMLYDPTQRIDSHFRIFYEDVDLGSSKFKQDKHNKLVQARYELLTDKLTHISLIPNFECAGACTYCYARATRTEKSGYISNDTLDTIRLKYNNFKDLDSVIVYGGEPVLEPKELERLLNYFNFNGIMPNVITGLLYSDEVFAELQRLLRENPQFQLTMSIDVWSENYGRKLKGYTDEELFNLTVERVVAILNEFGNTRAGLRLTVTDDSADFIKLTNLIKSKLLVPDLNITVEPVTDSELSQKTITKMVECATMWNDSEKIIMGPSRRFCFNPITTPGAYTNIIGDCNQLFGGITIDPYGNLHGCSETVTHSNEFLLTEELGSVRCNTWDKCNDCDFNSLCGGLCYAVRPTGTSCSWRVFNVLEAIYQSFQKMGKDKMKEAIKLNNEETI